ncbi:hypothetical protein ABIE67_008431 [Streptomyces sp. V4I8]
MVASAEADRIRTRFDYWVPLPERTDPAVPAVRPGR